MPDNAMLLMGFAAMLSSGLNPEIMLAIDFWGLFALLFGQAKSSKKLVSEHFHNIFFKGHFTVISSTNEP